MILLFFESQLEPIRITNQSRKFLENFLSSSHEPKSSGSFGTTATQRSTATVKSPQSYFEAYD